MNWTKKLFGGGAASFETVKIGNQVWMASNFTPEEENAQTDPSWNEAKHGRLFSFEEALRLAPHGWHLPTVEEWNQLNANISRSLDSKKLLLKEFQLVLLDGRAWFWTSTTTK